MFNDGIDADIRRFQTESEQNQFVIIIINRFACLMEHQRNTAIHCAVFCNVSTKW